jgi:hypothetical protein
VAHWYPTQERADAVVRELERLRAATLAFRNEPGQFLLQVSRTLMSSGSIRGFPQHQAGRWVWLASQFRILAQSHDASAAEAGAALSFLFTRLSRESLNEDDIQDLNWALDSTVRKLKSRLQPGSCRSNLSPHELLAIEARLAHVANIPFEPEKLRVDIQLRLV